MVVSVSKASGALWWGDCMQRRLTDSARLQTVQICTDICSMGIEDRDIYEKTIVQELSLSYLRRQHTMHLSGGFRLAWFLITMLHDLLAQTQKRVLNRSTDYITRRYRDAYRAHHLGHFHGFPSARRLDTFKQSRSSYIRRKVFPFK